MNKVKKVLIEKANEQEIHDLKDDILNNVDTSKVSKKSYVSKPNRGSFIPKMMILAGSVSLVVVALAGILTNSKRNNNNEKPITPSESSSEESYTDTTIPSTSNDFSEIEVLFEEGVLENLSGLDYYEIKNIEKNNIINIYDSLSKFNPVVVDLDSNIELKEEALVNELYFYYNNIENMLGISNIETSSNIIIDNEEIINYSSDKKFKVSMEGSVSDSNNSLPFNGTKEIKDGKLIYNINFEYNDYIILINEEYGKPNDEGKKTNKFEYIFKNNDVVVDKFNVTQTIKIDDSTKITKFINDNFTINSFKVVDGNIKCGFEKSNEELTISKDNDSLSFEFKLSNNTYNR